MDERTADLLHHFVFALDRAADRLLRQHLGISYSRALFRLTLHRRGTVTQHELATALGHSDPAISVMVQSLVADGYVQTAPSPVHRRKRLVSLTAKGRDLVARGRQLLDDEFTALVDTAGIDQQHYTELTRRLYQALVSKEHPHER